MADEVDQANEASEKELQARIANIAQTSSGLRPRGACHNCGDRVSPGHLFCDDECAEDYDYIKRRERANGYSG